MMDSQILTLMDGTQLEVTFRAVADGISILIEAFVNDTVACRDVELVVQN